MVRYLENEGDGMDSVSGLWERLRGLVAERALTFQERYRDVSFEGYITVLREQSDGRMHLVKAVEGEEPVGFSLSTMRKDGAGWVEAFYVLPSQRGKGLGAELLDRSVAWIRSQDAKAVRLTVTPGNEEVMDFYRSRGFELWKYVMEIEGGKLE